MGSLAPKSSALGGGSQSVNLGLFGRVSGLVIPRLVLTSHGGASAYWQKCIAILPRTEAARSVGGGQDLHGQRGSNPEPAHAHHAYHTHSEQPHPSSHEARHHHVVLGLLLLLRDCM